MKIYKKESRTNSSKISRTKSTPNTLTLKACSTLTLLQLVVKNWLTKRTYLRVLKLRGYSLQWSLLLLRRVLSMQMLLSSRRLSLSLLSLQLIREAREGMIQRALSHLFLLLKLSQWAMLSQRTQLYQPKQLSSYRSNQSLSRQAL